ncbi:SDR family NAD(P)-dependent oxidoreductase [Microbacterium sp.]|uniref:SDR family NAD(P)-dependent oxidoreductase n=1 Tax=Microbacterium sp. TaxID=51671 RepID=UPI0025EBBC73|nr:SDR family NAD(P)-dependent oxidoreductase [Microbacterium sp.]
MAPAEFPASYTISNGGYVVGRLDNRVAVVTGAGGGIGAEIAKLFASEGAKVVVNDLGAQVDGTGADVGPAQGVVNEIIANGGEAIVNGGDVSDYDSAGGIVQSAIDTFGKLDILVNVAGILRDRMLVNLTPEDWQAVLNVHLTGTFNTSKHAAVYWREHRGEGQYRLINFTSGAGLFGSAGQPNYAAAKLGIVGFTLSCAHALDRYGVTSNAIAPAASTRMTGTIPPERAAEMGINLADLAPSAIAYPVAYLASEESSWLNGRVVGAQGGKVTLYENYHPESVLVSQDAWTIDGIFESFPRAFHPEKQGLAGIA